MIPDLEKYILIAIAVFFGGLQTSSCPAKDIRSDHSYACDNLPVGSQKQIPLPCSNELCKKYYLDCSLQGEAHVLPCAPGLPWTEDQTICRNRVRISIQSEGCADPGIDKSIRPCGTGSIIVDGIERSLMQRGQNMVLVDYITGEYTESISFDFHGDANSASAFASKINSIRNETIILTSAQDEAGKSQTVESENAFLSIGATVGKVGYRGSMALIGYKGVYPVTWIKQTSHLSGKGPSRLTDEYVYIV